MKKILWLLVCLLEIASMSSGAIIGRNVANDGYLTAGEYEYGEVKVTENSLLTVMGGGAYAIVAKNNGYIEMSSTSLPLSSSINGGGVWGIALNDNSSLSISGGATNVVNLYDDSTALLTGGQINYIASYQTIENGTHIELVCQKGWSFFEIDGIVEGIDGTWMNGTDFHIEFINKNEDGCAFVYENMLITPEPTTLVLFALGGVFLKRHRA